MIFLRDKFQADCKRQMRRQFKSYKTVSDYMKVSKSVTHNWLNKKQHMRVNDLLMLCDHLDINPLRYIEDDEYQMRLI